MIAKAMLAFSRRVNGVLFALAVLATGLMLIPTVFDVVAREWGQSSLHGAGEMVECLMAVLVFGSLGYLNDRRAHLRVELLIMRLPKQTRRILDGASTITGAVFFSLMAYNLWVMALTKIAAGETTFMLGLPAGPLRMIGVAGLACLAFSLLAQAVHSVELSIRRKRWPELLAMMLASAALLALPFAGHALLGASSGTMSVPGTAGVLGMLFLLCLLLMGIPIGMVMAGVGYAGLVVLYPSVQAANIMAGMTPWTSVANPVYAVIPMFILMGELALCAGISGDLFRAASAWLGHLPGGLAIATVSGCAGFAAVSGDSMATSVTMAAVALPEMEKQHYDPGLACATLAAGGTLGILIPPSTGFIFYSLVTEESVGKLFVAGIVPGLLLTLLFALLLYGFALLRPDLAPRGKKATLHDRLRSLRGVLPMLGLVVLILGGMLSGMCSPNEGGAVGAAGTALYGAIRGRLSLRSFIGALRATALITARLLLILMGVGLLSTFFAASALPMRLADVLANTAAPPLLAFAGIVIFYMMLGCVMNVVPMILLTLPALYPSVMALGFDPLWFGVVVVIMMEMGQITPPVGLNVFAMSAVARHVPMPDIFRRITPFFLAMLMLVALLVLFPGLATWLPSLLF